MKKIIVILFLIIPLSLNAQTIVDGARTLTRKEAFGHNLWMLFNWYTSTYAKCPQSANDLIIYIERMDEDSQMVYMNQYRYLKRYKNRITFETNIENGDSIVNMYKGRRLDLATQYIGPCEYIRTARIKLFDYQGFYFQNEDLTQQINDRLKLIYVKYQEQLKLSDDVHRTGSRYDKIVVEITATGIRNLCNNNDIDLSHSIFFAEIYDYFSKIMSDNNISRIITPVFTD